MPAPSEHLSPQQRQLRDVRRRALGQALAQARQQSGLTQGELAAVSGVSRPTISRLEQGTSSISSDRLWELAIAVGTTPAAIFEAAQSDERTMPAVD